ncbi:MAG: hypothetical protein KJP25_09905 [Gammaproteobacteria bacterium]|nr:hypothetical protein [Gammaproteobacteria bacterium]NND38683.1 hypothetical protein [Pseudomonadales bacterium]NNL11901.1 hypothetical protein [Pseudomonadales bacterium]NNM11013.1 hypothetical protein [Pseudomonadales bacterium]
MTHSIIKPHEYWPPRVFEFPFYFYLFFQCLRNRVSVRDLAKANYALDHGEIGIGSKYQTQLAFPQQRFLPTLLLEAGQSAASKEKLATEFAQAHGYPLILKPCIGIVGKGILKIDCAASLNEALTAIDRSYLLQQFCNLPEEYGVFYIRLNGESQVTGINKKHFPGVTGDGHSTLEQLASRHERFSHHWASFLKYHDLASIPAAGQKLQLSFIGSHTMGCMFTDDSELVSPALEREIFSICDAQPGFNFGRLDVRAASDEALQAGDFRVIEVNGVSSLPTHMFDPGKSLREAYAIFFQHGKYLAKIAREHRSRSMSMLPAFALLKKVIASQRDLNQLHERLKEPGQTGLNG